MKIHMAHGGGGVESCRLIEDVFMRHFANDINAPMADAAIVNVGGRLAFTTDSFVVRPLFFPGGDIGRLAVCGTVNDLLTTGAKPLYLSAAFILEEGLPLGDLERICASMAAAAAEAGVAIVTGDTKVVDGAGGMSINTAGIGEIRGRPVCFADAREGDALLVTGTLGDHHACILGRRMSVENGMASDAAPLTAIVESLMKAEIPLHGMRDITRGGLATILAELSKACGLSPVIREEAIPIGEEVASFARILGLDPLYMGNEGKALLVVPHDSADDALERVRASRYGSEAAIIGRLGSGNRPILVTRFGGRRLLSPMRGEGLPRIC